MGTLSETVELKKTYISLVLALPKSISDKGAAKKQKSLTKIVFWTSEQPFIIHFLLVSCNVCPMVIPEICT